MGKSSSVKVLCIVQGFSYTGVGEVEFIVLMEKATKTRIVLGRRRKDRGLFIVRDFLTYEQKEDRTRELSSILCA